MKLFHAGDHPPQPADSKTFTGTASVVRMDGVNERPAVNVYRVEFQPTARTAWHSHSGSQLLLVIEGRCRLQRHGEPIQEIASGGAARIESGECHWHGATPDAPMVHLAVNIDSTTEWFEEVTDDQYAGHP